MDRNDFLKTSAIIAGATLLPSDNVFSQSLQQSGLDRLTDREGNFALQPLPYNETFLEPSMDQETLHLHYTFHHGDAVKAANKDLAMIKDAIEKNSLDTVDYWTKKLSFHLSSHILHTIFWTNLTNKKSDPSGVLLKQIEKDFGSYDKLKVLLARLPKEWMATAGASLDISPTRKS
jgi:Fe-Mn family superoxide dismutase